MHTEATNNRCAEDISIQTAFIAGGPADIQENEDYSHLMTQIENGTQLEEVAKSKNGKRVLKAILEQGTPEQKHRIAQTVCDNLSVLIQSIHAQEVLVEVLQKCSPEDQNQVACALSSTSEVLLLVAASKNRHHLIEAALAVGSDSARQMQSQLKAIAPTLATSADFGDEPSQRVLELIRHHAIEN